MKLKTTRKEMARYPRIVRVGYCQAQNLLKYRSPFAYSCGVYGWNGDYYEVDGVLIATGYRSLPDTTGVKCSYDLVRKYDNMAEGKSAGEVERILQAFILEITR